MGSLLFSDNKKGSQILAFITNNTFTQTFSISSQTSNCYDEGLEVHLQQRQEEFVAFNYSALQKEMAMGQGEKLESFARLLGCNTPASFAHMTQKSYVYFFGTPVKTPAEFVERVKIKIKTDEQVLSACRLNTALK